MHASVIVISSVMLLLNGVSCSHYPAAVRHVIDLLGSHSKVAKDDKRQDPDGECLANKLRDADLDQQCLTAFAGLDIDITDSPSQAQSTYNQIFSEICKPDCGNPVLEAFVDCGADSDNINIFAGLCGTQSNGDKCYESFVSGETFSDDEAESCYENIENGGSCDCKSELQAEVEVQGCCIRIYDDAAASNGEYDEGELFNRCSVTLPGRCNNSPISSSMALGATATAVVTALILSVGLVLG